MKLMEEIKYMYKEHVFDVYTRIVSEFKDYEKISRPKMLESIYKVYEEPYNIIDICTERELKFLQLVVKDNSAILEDDYEWEISTLRDKFLLFRDFHSGQFVIPEEIYDFVCNAIKQIDWKQVKEKDKINEFMVPYLKVMGVLFLPSFIQISSTILDMDLEKIEKHVFENRVFRFYVYIDRRDLPKYGDQFLAIYEDYYGFEEDVLKKREKFQATSCPIDARSLKTLFYNDFDIRKSKIKQFYEETKQLGFFYIDFFRMVKIYALLNDDRTELKEALQNVYVLRDKDLSDYFKILDKAMDEMQSGALNGLTPNEYKKRQKENVAFQINQEKNYEPQQDACLSKKECDLFYKLYFGLLDFTNQKYQILPKLKIYKQEGLDPDELSNIVRKLWEEPTVVIDEFVKKNPFKFNKEELKIVEGFKKGIRDHFVMAQYTTSYTAMCKDGKCYMIKGLNCNIDEVISYDEIPDIVETTLLPFLGKIVYDGIILSYPISFGLHFKELALKEYNESMKYYHL